MTIRAALAALLLVPALPASAQLGAAPQSPPPEGVPADGGAGNPKGHYHELDALPDWGGIWFVEFGASRREAPVVPKLKGEYLERYNAWRAQVAANDGVVPRPRSNCSPPGMPRIMRLAQYPYEFLFTPGRVTINQEAWMQTRTIWTDGRAHEEDPDPTFMGDSIGRWEDDVLIVNTRGFLPGILSADARTPHSDAFEVTERFRLDPENGALIREYEATDGVYWTGTYRGSDTLYVSALPFEPYNCDDRSFRTDRVGD